MRRLLAVGLITVLLIASFPAFGTAQSNAPTTPQKITTSQEFDDVEFIILVNSDGDALWTFRYEKTLETKQEHEQFKEFANSFNSSDTELYTNFRENAVKLTSTANNQTKRKMTASNFSKRAFVDHPGMTDDTKRGVVEMSFRWSAFAYGSGNTTVMGDVFKGGLYLGNNQKLVIKPADGMSFKSAQPVKGRSIAGSTLAESDSVSWSGEREFNDQRPMVTFSSPPQSSSTTNAPSSTTDNASAPPGNGGEKSGSNSPTMLFVAAVVLLIGLAAVFVWRQGSLGSLSSGRSTPGGGGGGSSGSAATESPTSPAEPAVSDEELLTDEARVKKLLRENGGRMKQVNIVDETGWSKSKVSMLLSEMEEDGEISKLRVGRENIISLDGHEPDAAGSPLDR